MAESSSAMDSMLLNHTSLFGVPLPNDNALCGPLTFVCDSRQILVHIVTTLSFVLFHALLKVGIVVRPISTCFQRHKVSTIIFLLYSV